MTAREAFDVVVVGGGPAGLSAGLTLGRARRSVLVVDAGEPRNAPAAHVHGYLTRDGTPPGELLALGRGEVERYGGEVRPGRVSRVDGDVNAGFRVHLADGSVVPARRLVVASGLHDELPDLPGLSDRWGSAVLHCPYCHGWEVQDRPIGVLASGLLSNSAMAAHAGLLWRQWSDDVVLFTHTAPPLDPADRQRLEARGVRVVEGEVTGLEGTEDRLTGVRLAHGDVVRRDALVVSPRLVANADVLAALGLMVVDQEMADVVFGTAVPAGQTGATSVSGVWVAGNVTDPVAQVVTSASAGVSAAAAVNADLIAEEAELAVHAS